MTRKEFLGMVFEYAKSIDFEIKGGKLIFEGKDCGCFVWSDIDKNEYRIDTYDGSVLISDVNGNVYDNWKE